MLRACLAAPLLLAALAGPAAATPCLDVAGNAYVCSGFDLGDAKAGGVWVMTADGAHAEASFYEGPAFVGNALVAIAWVHHPAAGGAYGGFGGSDYEPDGDYEHACVCGEVYVFALGAWVPWGAGHYDHDHDGEVEVEGVYVQGLP